MLFGDAAGYTIPSPDAKKQKHGPIVFTISFLFSLVAAYVFAVYLGEDPELGTAIKHGFLIGLGFVATSFGINYLFAGRSMTLLLIDAGYHIVQFTLYGVILGLWH